MIELEAGQAGPQIWISLVLMLLAVVVLGIGIARDVSTNMVNHDKIFKIYGSLALLLVFGGLVLLFAGIFQQQGALEAEIEEKTGVSVLGVDKDREAVIATRGGKNIWCSLTQVEGTYFVDCGEVTK